MSYICQLCSFKTFDKTDYSRHLLTVKHTRNIILSSELETAYEELKKRNTELEKKAEQDALEIKLLRENVGKFEAIVEKAATKPTTTINHTTGNTKTTNNILNILSSKPLNQVKFQEAIARQFSTNLVLRGDDALANVILAELKDDEGKYKISCTDLSRQNFQYKDINGDVKSDPQLTTLMDGLRETTKDKYQDDVRDELYDAAHMSIDKQGNSELDADYLFKLKDRARFKSKKVVKNIARKTYTRKPKVKIVFLD